MFSAADYGASTVPGFYHRPRGGSTIVATETLADSCERRLVRYNERSHRLWRAGIHPWGVQFMAMPEFQQYLHEVKQSVHEIQPRELRTLLASGEPVSLIDVREPEEWQQGSIPGAVPIARGWLEMRIDQVTTDRKAKLVLYCAGGNRSALAAESLQRMGFGNVMSLAGGYRAWLEGK